MLSELRKTNKNLYETDYNLWALETATKLKSQDLDGLDWDNLIEEVEDLSRRDKRRMESLLMKLIGYLLILRYWQIEKERNRGHWEREIFNYRKQINRLLMDSPSLNNYLASEFNACYMDAR
jgi:hypothetical protein